MKTTIDLPEHSSRPFPPKMGDSAEDGVERGIQMFAEVFGEETQDVAAAFLKQGVLAAVTAIGGRIR